MCRHRRNLLTFSEAAFLHWWIIFYFVLETSVIFVIYRLQVIIKFQSSPINDNNQSRNTNDQQSVIYHQTVKTISLKILKSMNDSSLITELQSFGSGYHRA